MSNIHILMPVYNSKPFIEQTLASVFQQDYPDFTLILWDDGSKDGTMEIVKKFISDNKIDENKIKIFSNVNNRGYPIPLKQLYSKSKELDPNAYICRLDSDDQFTRKDALSLIMSQMLGTKADVCVYSFTVKYENESVIPNAAGLLNDKENSEKILKRICETENKVVSALDEDVLSLTSLGWVKCYAPTVELPDFADYPFEDFVFMAILLQAKKITAIDPSTPLIEYLRRSTSICGKRMPENFTLHVPTQLQGFIDAVVSSTQNDEDRGKKIEMAKQFVLRKLNQYTLTLETIIKNKTYDNIDESVLLRFSEVKQKLIDLLDNDATYNVEKYASSAFGM